MSKSDSTPERPSHWEECRLGEIVDILDSERIPINSTERQKRLEGAEERFPYYGATGQVGWIDDYLFDEELVLLGEDGAPFLEPFRDVTYIVDGKVWVNNHVHVLRAKKKLVTSRYLMHYLNTVDYHDFVTGTTRLKLNQGRLKKIPVFVPPLPEQRRIVAKIEELFSNLDAGRADLQTAQRQLERYRLSVLQAAVEGRLTAAWRRTHTPEPADALLDRILDERRKQWERDYRAKYEAKGKEPPSGWKSRYKEAEEPDIKDLPKLPDGWVWASGDQVLQYVTSGSRGWSKYYAENGQLFVRVGDISNPDIEIDRSDIQRVDLPDNERGHRSLLKPDDLLISITADVGKVGIVPDDIEEAYINQHVALTRPSSPDTAKYLAYYIISPAGGRRQFLNMQRGATKAGLTLTDIKNLKVALPPEPELNQIVAEVERLLSVADDAVQTTEREHTRAERLRQSILKQAFSGQLVSHEVGTAPPAPTPSGNGAQRPGEQIELEL